MELPPIIQGGMGIGVSGWRLAGAVSREGQIGVVSGPALAVGLVQRLQRGDPGGFVREALAAFPSHDLAGRVLAGWYIVGGRAKGEALKWPPMPAWPMNRDLIELMVAAVFAEIYLAKKHGGNGLVGINMLTKIEVTTLPSLYGAMLADVDAVFMGAGIPRMIPGVLEAFARGEAATLALTVEGSGPEMMRFDPAEIMGTKAPELRRPLFFPIVSSDVLAAFLLRKANGVIDGFVVEDYTAGGHNAPPRGKNTPNQRGEPVWDDRDRPSLGAFRKLGLPFYMAGGQDDSMALRAAQAQGARGVQIGTAFAFCEESGLRPELKAAVLQAARSEIDIVSDALASSTGFPFKVVQLAGTLSEPKVYADRARNCDLGYLRTAYRKSDGTVGWRCSAEREAAYISKGGLAQDLAGRRCLCAGLMSASGCGDPDEPAILTAGYALRHISRHLRNGSNVYAARDVIHHVLGNGSAN